MAEQPPAPPPRTLSAGDSVSPSGQRRLLTPERLVARARAALADHRAGRLAEAGAGYESILAEAPQYAPALNGLGLTRLATGEPDRARTLLAEAVALRPDSARYRYNLGNALDALGQTGAAAAAYRQALRLDPAHVRAARRLGALLRRHGRIDAAIACLRRVVALTPDDASAHNDLGSLYMLRGLGELALACFGRALDLDPSLGEARFNRGKLRAETSPDDAARADLEAASALVPRLATEAACHLAVLHRHFCDWEGEPARVAALCARIEKTMGEDPRRGLPPLTLNVVPVPAALRLAVARHLGRGVERETQALRERCAFRHTARRDTERLRIGYVSPDFRTHAVGTMIHDLFRHHDRDAGTVHAYSLVELDDPYQRSVRAGVDAFADVSRESHAAIARRIHADGIDVLVDLAGYTTHSRTAIFALRPAPVQMHWLGYLDSMGADFLPYILADARVIPPGSEDEFSETVVRLPHGFALAPAPPAEATPGTAPSRDELGLPDDAFVFCCMNGLHKLDAECFAAWMRILARTPGSVLWLPAGAPTARANLERAAATQGVDPARLHFSPRVPLAAYLARYRCADLFLDTFAYNAGATAAGALRMGLPLLTKPGTSFMSRMGASLCAAAGIPEMVCADIDAYEERAVALAMQPGKLDAVRRQLAEARDTAPLFDAPRFARQLEAAYRTVWKHHHDVSGSRCIDVARVG